MQNKNQMKKKKISMIRDGFFNFGEYTYTNSKLYMQTKYHNKKKRKKQRIQDGSICGITIEQRAQYGDRQIDSNVHSSLKIQNLKLKIKRKNKKTQDNRYLKEKERRNIFQECKLRI